MQHSPKLWLLEESYAQEFFKLRAAFVGPLRDLTEAELSAQVEKARASVPTSRREKAIGIIPVTGALESRATVFGQMFGMSSYSGIGRLFDHFMADDSISGVMLDVASPGGDCYLCGELANKIYSARGKKPIVAVANPLMASGAFWIAAAADRIVVTPSGDVGSVGVIAAHVDNSAAYEKEGAKVTIVTSSGAPFKGETNDAGALTPEAMQHLQSRANAIEGRFMADLAKFRGVSVEHVAEHFGKGRIVDAKSAKAAGMADKVATFEEAAGQLATGRWRIASERAMDEWDAPTPRERFSEELKVRAAAIKAIAEQGVGHVKAEVPTNT